MKTKSLFIAALVVMSTVVVSVAGKDEPRRTGLAIIPVKSSNVFKVVYKGESVGKVKLNIFNAHGSLVFNQTIAGVEGFICPVNFTGLQSGDYTIELVDATGKRTEKISYQPKKNIQYVHISRIANADDKVLLSIANTGSESINVKIYNSKGTLLFTESKDINGNFAQVYKMGNAVGTFTFEITDNSGNLKVVKSL